MLKLCFTKCNDMFSSFVKYTTPQTIFQNIGEHHRPQNVAAIFGRDFGRLHASAEIADYFRNVRSGSVGNLSLCSENPHNS